MQLIKASKSIEDLKALKTIGLTKSRGSDTYSVHLDKQFELVLQAAKDGACSIIALHEIEE